MAKLNPTPGWDDVLRLEATTQALGGPGAVMNAQAQALLNRTEALRVSGEATGAALVAYDGGTAQDALDDAKAMQSYTALRAYTGRATGVRITQRGIAGFFQRLGTAGLFDNGGTIIIDALGRAWERLFSGDVHLSWFVPTPGVGDDAPQIQKAIDYAVSVYADLIVAGGTYRLVPTTTVNWEGGTCLAALVMRTNMHIRAVDGAQFKIADGVSTDAAPVHHHMFFTNQVLNNIGIRGLVMNMNGQNNKISPNRAAKDFNRFMNAQICVSGTIGGVGAHIDRCTIERCVFQNNNGVSCIVAGQSNTVGTPIGAYWNILYNSFEQVGLDTDDHSSIYGRITKSRIIGNRMVNAAAYNYTTMVGGRCAIEIHSSDNVIAHNTIENYQQGMWVTGNFTDPFVKNVIITGNTFRVVDTGLDFWSKNLLPYGEPECAIRQVSITGNTFEILDTASLVAVRSFIKFGARQQPSIVEFSGNVCRSYAAQDCALALFIVGADQRAVADQITITDNVAAGVCNGMVAYFSGDATSTTTRNIGRVKFQNNDLGVLTSSAVGLVPADVYLYGPNQGTVEGLRVDGLQHPTAPIVTDGHINGRARVYGRAILPTTVTWNGITAGNGSATKKIALDSDAGVAVINARFTAGGTSSATGPIYPSFSGIVADASGAAAATHTKTGAAVALPAIIENTASWVSLFGATAGSFGATEFSTSSVISVQAQIPCRYADV